VRLILAMAGEPAGEEPSVRRSPEIMHGLNNLIQNAVQFAAREVNITTFWDAATVTIEIGDDGPGFPLHLLGRLGEPYLSTRAGVTDHMGGRARRRCSSAVVRGSPSTTSPMAARMLRFPGTVPIWKR
jgi:two-component system sensor histidine kinase RegB